MSARTAGGARSGGAPIEYFYAAHSAYAWLGSARFRAIARAAGRAVHHAPMDLHRVLEATGGVVHGRGPLHFRYFFEREIERWAEYRGVPTLGRRPTWHDHRPDLANCMLIAAQEARMDVDALSHRLLGAHWAEDADLGDPDVLAGLAGEVGLEGGDLLERARTPAVQALYERNTRSAIERGVFGSPTWFVDGDMFFGQDRLELLERALEHPFPRRWVPSGRSA